MNGQSAKRQKTSGANALSQEKTTYGELARGFAGILQYELDGTAFEALDRILDLNEDDLFYCEVTCLSYAAHVLALENGPRELWIISNKDGECAFPHGDGERYVEEMTEKGQEVARAIGEDNPTFKGFANVPPGGPFKTLITTEVFALEGVPNALAWPEMSSYFHGHLRGKSKGAIIYPPLGEQPERQSLREGLLIGEGVSWAAELPDSRIIIGVGGSNGVCNMIDLSDPEDPWEIEASPFMIAACGGCLVPSMCRKLVDTIEETTLGGLAARISRGTALGRRAVNPRLASEAHRGEPLLVAGAGGQLQMHDSWLRDSRYGFEVLESDFLFLDSSCINADRIEPLFIDEIPRGQERYVVYPRDGVVLLISRNEKRSILYKALRPTLIANSVYIVWLDPGVDARYLECWLEGSYAERWLNTAGKMTVDPQGLDPILSKGTLSSLPVPVLESEVINQTIAREHAISERIKELYSEIQALESREAFAPASAMAVGIDGFSIAG